MPSILMFVDADGGGTVFHGFASKSVTRPGFTHHNAIPSFEAATQWVKQGQEIVLAIDVVKEDGSNIYSKDYGYLDRGTGRMVDLWEGVLRAPLGVRVFAARSKAAPESVLIALAEDPSFAVQNALSKNENTPAPALDKLAFKEKAHLVVEENVAGHNNTSAQTLAKMAEHKKVLSVLEEVASNENLFEETFWLLFKNRGGKVHQSLASNKASPAALLSKLASSLNEYVRQYVASNKRTLPDVLVSLSTDHEPMVRKQVALNTNTPPDTLHAMLLLSQDPSGPRTGAELGVQDSLTRNTSSPPQTLRALWDLVGWRIPENLAKNPSSPPDLLSRIALSTDWEVRRLVAKNKGATAEVLMLLARDKNAKVKEAAKSNPNYNPDMKPPRNKL